MRLSVSFCLSLQTSFLRKFSSSETFDTQVLSAYVFLSRPAGRQPPYLMFALTQKWKLKSRPVQKEAWQAKKERRSKKRKERRRSERCKLETFLFVQSCRGNCFTKNESKEEEKGFFFQNEKVNWKFWRNNKYISDWIDLKVSLKFYFCN